MPALGRSAPEQLVVPTGTAGRIVALAGDAAGFTRAAPVLRAMKSLGHQVVLIWSRGAPGKSLESFKARIPLSPLSLRESPRRVLQEVRRTGGLGWWSDRTTLAGQLATDPRARAQLEGATAVLLVGVDANTLREELEADGIRVVPETERAWWEEVGSTWQTYERLLDEGLTLDADLARELLDRIELMRGRVPRSHQWMLVPLVEAVHKSAHFDLAAQLLGHVRDDAADTEVGQVQLRGLRALVETSRCGHEAADLRGAAAALLSAADQTLADEGRGEVRIEEVADLVTMALELLFHRELHADQLTSPLVEEPEEFLRPWRASRVGALLSGRTSLPTAEPGDAPDREVAGDAPRTDVGGDAPGTGATVHGRAGDRGGERAPRVVVSPGTFPQFATVVVDALAERAEVEELDLLSRTELRYLGVSRFVVNRRLHEALGLARARDLELLARLEAADAAFLDWADRGALEVLMTAPTSLAVTLRVHSMDALSAWIHLIDWSRVRNLVVVSAHMQTLLERVLGEQLSGTSVHVVPNVVEADRFSTEKLPGHRRRLLMTGWGQRVKDPLWALEVLAALRGHDPSWRLTLLGADFLRHKAVSTDVYLDEFVERLVQDDVRGAVDFVGFTDDIAPHLARAGFILSLSRRESFGLGLMEGAASGAVPVVRNWPVYASLDGARSVVPDAWVVESVEQAVQRILEHAQEPAWSQESARARAEVQQRYSGAQTLRRLCDLVLGEEPPDP